MSDADGWVPGSDAVPVACPPSSGFLAGGGVMGARIRAYDWASTALGSPERWPQGLRTAVRLLLSAPQPMLLVWGPLALCLYNDACAAVIGSECHATAVGCAARDAFVERWDVWGPRIEQALAGRPVRWREPPLVADASAGGSQATWWDCSANPVDDAASPAGVGGVLVLYQEVAVLAGAERRLAFDRVFEQALCRSNQTPEAAIAAAAGVLAQHFAAQRVGYVECDAQMAHVTVAFSHTDARQEPELAGGVHRLADFGPQIVAALAAGRLVAIDDVQGHPLTPGAAAAAHEAIGARALLVAPVAQGGRTAAFVVIHAVAPRTWDAADASILMDAATHLHAMVERLRAQQALAATLAAHAESEARLRLALEAGGMGVFSWDVRTDHLEWDAAQRKLFGIESDESPPTARQAIAERVHPDDRAALDRDIAHAVAAGSGPVRWQFRIVRPDGAVRWLGAYGRVDVDADGRPVRLLGVNIDITDWHEAHEALARTHRQAQAAAERVQLALAAGAIIGTWDWDLTCDRFAVDELFAEHFGIEPVLGREGLSLEQVIATVHPEDLDGLRAAIAEAIGRGGHYSHEYRVRGRDGLYRWIQANGHVELAADGAPRRFPGVLLDVGQRRALEAERDLANELLSAFMEAVPGVMYVKGLDGRLLLVNQGAANVFGIAREALIGKSAADLVPDAAQAQAITDNDACVLASGRVEPIEEVVDLPDGTRSRWLSVKAPLRDAAGDATGLVGVSIDITARREAEERLAMAIDSSSLGWWDLDPRSGRVVWSGNARKLFDLPEEGTTSVEEPLKRLHPEDRPRIDAALTAALDPQGDGRYEETYRLRRADGSVRWVDAIGSAQFERIGARRVAVRFSGVLWDVTAQRQAALEREQLITQLTEREARLATLLAVAPVGIVMVEAPSGRVTRGNRRAEEIFGHPILPSAGIEQYHEWVSFHPDGRRVEPHEYPAARALREGVERAELEVHYQRGDGQRAWVRLVAAPLRVAANAPLSGAVIVALDVDPERRAIEALREADRRKDEFLALLAHELRNPLAPIINAVKLLQREEDLSARGVRGLEMIGRQSRQMRRLVDDLLEVSRITRGTVRLVPEPIMLGSLVLGVAEAAQPSADAKGLRLRTQLPDTAVRITADPVRIAQVLENLVGNAIKFTPAGGTVDVELSQHSDEVELRVVDDGIGIDPHKLDDIFDLFVQAEPGVGPHQGGLGIGLAMVKRLVELHGGQVRAESAGRGTGAVFVVRLSSGGGAAHDAAG